MNHQRHGLISIGAFAGASRLSLKALRLYAQLGLLKPRHVDEDSGYRYYHVEQLPEARRIRFMRQMDMPLATIRQVLAAAPADAETLVRAYWREREQRMDLARRMVSDLIVLLRQEVASMDLEVSVKTVEPQSIISINRRVKVGQLDQHIRGSLETLYAMVGRQGLETAGPPFGIYHGPVNQEDDGPMEVAVPVQSGGAPDGDVAARTLPGGKMATVMMRGEQCDFPAILAGYDAVYDWIRQNGYEPAEAPREIWHSEPGADAQMEVALRFQ